MKIRTRIMILFMVSILLTMTVSVFATAYFGRCAYIREVYDASGQTLQAVSGSIELTMQHIRQDTDAVFWNAVVQEKLETLKSAPMTSELRTTISDTISPILLSDDAISSVLFYDNYGNNCFSLRDGVLLRSDTPIQDTYWYDDVLAADGEWIYETDGGGIASYADDNRNVVSMLRVVKSKADYSVCGVIMVNIDEKTVRAQFASASGTATNFYILSGQTVIFGSKDKYALTKHLDDVAALPDGGQTTLKSGGKTQLYQKQALTEGGWELVSETAIASGLNINIGLMAVILLGNIALLLICWLFVSRQVSRPLKEMETHIGTAEGIPEDFAVVAGKTDEISTLKTAYNRMLASTRELLQKTREEEKSIQRGELELVLSQVSPHFLYNTLDTISGMIISGDNKLGFELVKALGRFYRKSLSNGDQIVTLGEELDTVNDYLIILNTRYGGNIRCEYHVSKKLRDTRVLKLMLQPLVENAVHHGLRPKGTGGVIVITAEEQDESLVMSVLDNGVGIPPEKIQEILLATKENTPGFGIFSIRQRIELFYSVKDPLTIESRVGEWTRVTIRIPRNGRQI